MFIQTGAALKPSTCHIVLISSSSGSFIIPVHGQVSARLSPLLAPAEHFVPGCSLQLQPECAQLMTQQSAAVCCRCCVTCAHQTSTRTALFSITRSQTATQLLPLCIQTKIKTSIYVLKRASLRTELLLRLFSRSQTCYIIHHLSAASDQPTLLVCVTK